MPHFVQLVKVTGVTNGPQLLFTVQRRYPQARIWGGSEPRTAFIALPDVAWNFAPGGDKDFFCALSRMGVITNYMHRRYGEWDQEVAR